ncbi:MAG: 3-dehydroquinate synthase [Clostridia bacterium]|nr:3-dehydroquinate synthase [Clostridia bacterium]
MMEKIKVPHAAGEYTIYAGEGILKDAFGEFDFSKYDRVFLVSDSNVWSLWGEKMTEVLASCGITLAGHYVFPAGETSKRLETVSDMYAAFAAASLTRRSILIALGGGVCGDMTGFAAATYLRGIAVIQVPTTLLSQIDSSIGGKTGVDLAVGKNLVGAFWQPAAVIADSAFLDTLPRRYIDDGMGEAIKYGCIWDEQLFDAIADKSIDRAEMIARCMKIKAEVVSTDERDTGLRAILNYGHTIGHAVEKLGGFSRFSHGESVGIGMLYAAKVGEAMGCPKDIYGRILAALQAWELPTVMDYAPEALIDAARADKKREGDEISFVLLEKIGKCYVKKVPISELAGMIQ